MTKIERLKLARKVRAEVGLYLLFNKTHVRDGHANADDIAWACLIEAKDKLEHLMDVERANRAGRASVEAQKKFHQTG